MVNSPTNPTGRVLTRAEIDALSMWQPATTCT
jgi:aspartate/methionine/tyrosine aminotransferase